MSQFEIIDGTSDVVSMTDDPLTIEHRLADIEMKLNIVVEFIENIQKAQEHALNSGGIPGMFARMLSMRG